MPQARAHTISLLGRVDAAGGAVMAASFGALILILIFASPVFFDNDPAQYLSTVDQLTTRGALSTTVIFFDSQAAQGMPAAQTVWPPLFPAAAAAVVAIIGVDAVTALAIVNGAAHAASIALLFWVGLSLGVARAAAAFWAILFGVYWNAWAPALSGGSEPLFACLLIGGFAALARIDADAAQRDRVRLLILAGAFFGLATATRYLGLVFVAALCLSVLWAGWRSGALRRGFIEAIAAGAPAAVIVGPLLVRNLLLTGSLTGGPSGRGGNALLDLIGQTRTALGVVFGASGGIGWVFVGILALSFGAAIIIWARSGAFARALPAEERAAPVIATAALGVMLTVVLVYGLALTTTAYVIEGRYFAPLAAVAIVLGFALARAAPPPRRATLALRLSAAAVVALMVLNASVTADRLARGSVQAVVRAALEAPYGAGTVGDFLAAEGGVETPLLSNQSQQLYTAARLPTIGVPPRRLTPLDWSPADVADYARGFGASLMVVFKDAPLGGDIREDAVMRASQAAPAGFTKLLETDALVLFRVEGRNATQG